MNDKKTLLIIGDQKNYINLDDVAEFGIGEVRDVPIAEFRNIIMADNFNVDNTVFIKGFAETEDYIRPILSLNKKLNNADKPAAPGSAAAGKKPRRTDWLTLCILLWNPNRPSEKPVIVTDAGIIPDPNLTQKKAITKNAIAFARNIGLSENPIVNFMTISSSTDQNVKSSRDTEKLEKWLARAEPGARATHYADDPILSEAARRNKNIDDFTAPDIIVCHYIEQAQAEYKLRVHLGGYHAATLVGGCNKRIRAVLNSRGDSKEIKVESIAVACMGWPAFADRMRHTK